MRGRNNCEFIGNLTSDPKVFDWGVAFSLAVNERYKDKQGEWQDSTEYIDFSSFGGLADVVAKHLSKGSPAFVVGRFSTRKFDQDGVTHRRSGIKVFELILLPDGKRTAGGDGGQSSSNDDQGGPLW